jgi:transketolase
MPSWELFEQQDDDYKDAVFPVDLPTVSVEAGVRMGWERYADAIVSIDRFGASAPGELVLEKLGITPDNVVAHVHELLGTKV